MTKPSKQWYKNRTTQTLIFLILTINFAILQFQASNQLLNNHHNNNHHNDDTFPQIKLKTPKLPNPRITRTANFHTWYQNSHLNQTTTLLPNADSSSTTTTPILDFIIAGFPKCGTTTLSHNLAYIAPMSPGDICTPVHQTVYYAYQNWPDQYRDNPPPSKNKTKEWRGVKCPSYISGLWLQDYSIHLPKTKVLVGIRHPVLWFQSFWNMQLANRKLGFAHHDPYTLTKGCKKGRECRNGCPDRQLFCVDRGRFHVALAKLGKTDLSVEERELFGGGGGGSSNAEEDVMIGDQHGKKGIRNPIFLYEQKTLSQDYFWDELGDYLGVEDEPLQRDIRRDSHGKNRKAINETDFCHDLYDDFRAIMMPIAYNLSVWLQDYFIPLAMDVDRVDVVIPRPDLFGELVEEYKFDPCGKLMRLSNGTFVLDSTV